MASNQTLVVNLMSRRSFKINNSINNDPNRKTLTLSILGIVRLIVQWHEDSPNWIVELSPDGPVHNKWKVIG